MAIHQISVFLENRKGRLCAVTQALAEADISIYALAVADTMEFGIIRLVVDDVEKATEVLKNNSISYHVNDITAVEVDSRPGGLSSVLQLFVDTDINVEYMYTLAQSSLPNPVLLLRFSEPTAARELLRKNGVRLLDDIDLNIK